MKLSRLASGLISLSLSVVLVSCGMFDFEEREPWRAQAEAACFSRGDVKLSPLIQKANAIEGKGICGLDRPLRVRALEDGSVSLGSRALVLSCPMTAALERWLRDSVMPAAYARYGVPVIEIRNFGSYNCRTRNNVPGARLSEHAFANAFDFAGVVLANGYVVTVKKGWYGNATDRAFLRQIAAGACGPFTTLLGPGSDGVHEDHLHLDLAHHNAAGTYRYCKPKPQVPDMSTPVFQAGSQVPVASADTAVWPKVLPETVEASTRRPPLATPSGGGFDSPLLPPAPVAQAPAVAAPVAQAPVCPAGYVCTPADTSALPPPPSGWSVGPQPVQGYSGDITGSINGYSDQ